MSNDPRFEVYELHTRADSAGRRSRAYGWRFRAANGKISAVAGEGFTRRADAHRAIDDFVEALVHSGPIKDVER